MKKRISGFLLCLALVLTGCSDSSGVDPVIDSGNSPGNEPNPVTGTWVRFVNNNMFPVIIYGDSARQVKFAEIPAESQSDLMAASPNSDGAHFYPAYQIVIENLSLSYNGNEVIVRIDANKTTTITVPSFKDLAAANPDKQLTTDVYLIIKNNGNDSLLLRKNSNELLLEGTGSPILNGNETGTYKIVHGPVSDYSLRRNTVTPVDFPEGWMNSPPRAYTCLFLTERLLCKSNIY